MSGEHVEFIELIFTMSAAFSIRERDQVEEALGFKLLAEGIGAVSGTGVGMGFIHLDIDVAEAWQQRPDDIQQVIFSVLHQFTVPSGSTMRMHLLSGKKIMFATGIT